MPEKERLWENLLESQFWNDWYERPGFYGFWIAQCKKTTTLQWWSSLCVTWSLWLLLGPPMPNRLKDRDHTKCGSPGPPGWGFGWGLITLFQKTLLLQKPEGEKIHFNKANQEKWRDSVPWGAKRIGEVRSACKRLVWKKLLDHKAHALAGFLIYCYIWLFLYYLIITNFTMTLI